MSESINELQMNKVKTRYRVLKMVITVFVAISFLLALGNAVLIYTYLKDNDPICIIMLKHGGTMANVFNMLLGILISLIDICILCIYIFIVYHYVKSAK